MLKVRGLWGKYFFLITDDRQRGRQTVHARRDSAAPVKKWEQPLGPRWIVPQKRIKEDDRFMTHAPGFRFQKREKTVRGTEATIPHGEIKFAEKLGQREAQLPFRFLDFSGRNGRAHSRPGSLFPDSCDNGLHDVIARPDAPCSAVEAWNQNSRPNALSTSSEVAAEMNHTNMRRQAGK